jgi:hypothetical protein
MELLSDEIYNLRISPSQDDYIYKFSKLNLDELELESNKKVLVGFHIFRTNMLPIENYDKRYYIAVTNYFTEKNYKHIYPFHNTLSLTTLKATKNPMKLFKEKYELTKTDISKCQIYEVFNSQNIIIYSVNIPKIFKNIKKMKITKNIHLYSNPFGEKTIENIYQDIISTKFSTLNKRFFFFHDNVKISLKEKHILERIC